MTSLSKRVQLGLLLLANAAACSKPRHEDPPPDPHLRNALEMVRTDPAGALLELDEAKGAPTADVAYARGLAYERQDKTREAAAAYQAALEADPKALAAHVGLARLELSQGNLSIARQHLNAVLARDAGDLQTALLLALIAKSEAERDEALIVLKSWPKARPGGEAAGALPAEYLITLSVLEPDDRAAEAARSKAISATIAAREATFMLARYAAALGNGPLAKALLTELARSEKDEEMLVQIGNTALATGALEAVRDAISHLPGLKPSYATSLLRGRYEMATKHPLEAARQLQDAVKHIPESETPNLLAVELLLARAQVEAKLYPQAAETLDRILAAHPGHVEASGLYAQLELATKQPEAALKRMADLVAARPEDAQLGLALARVQVKLERYKEAQSTYEKLAELQPDVPAHADQIARMLMARGKRLDALKQWEDALERFPTAAQLLRPYALLALNTRGLEAAVSAVKSRLDREPVRFSLLLADLYEEAKRPKEVEATLTELTRAHPEDARPWAALARLQQRKGDVRGAIESLRTASDLEPENLKHLANLSGLYVTAGRTQDAAAAYERLASLGDDVVALNNAAMLYAGELNDPDKAVRYAERAIRLAPKNPAIADTLGWALARRGSPEDLTRARPMLEAASAQLATPEAKFHYGYSLVKLGKLPEGRKLVSEALTSAPNAPWKHTAESVLQAARP